MQNVFVIYITIEPNYSYCLITVEWLMVIDNSGPTYCPSD